jgi:hypothetical protein
MLRGNVIIDNDEYLGDIGDGEYIPRATVTVNH